MKAGDHIRISRGGALEHAIDLGDRTVIHFVNGQGVRRSRLEQLAPNGARVEVVTHAERVFPRKQVVARAFSRFSSSAYAAMFADSEAFAVWCKNGRIPAPGMPLGALQVAPPAARPSAKKPARSSVAGSAAKSRSTAGRGLVPHRKGLGPRRKKVSAVPGKAARSTKAAPAAKHARGAKRAPAIDPSARKKTVRPSKSAGRSPPPVKAKKRTAPARAAKAPKRGKAAARRAASGR